MIFFGFFFGIVSLVDVDMELALVNSQATSDYFDDQGLFKTLTRLAYTMDTLDIFSFRVLDALNYTNVAVIYDEVMPWSQVLLSQHEKNFLCTGGISTFKWLWFFSLLTHIESPVFSIQ